MQAEFLQEMVDSVGVGVGAYGEDGEFLYVNQAYSELFDVEPAALNGVPVWEINEEIDPERFESYWHSFEAGETRTAEAIHGYNGNAVEVETLTTRVQIDGDPYNIGTIKDITLRKTRERQLGQLHDVTRELIEANSKTEIAEITARTAETVLGYESSVVWFVDQTNVLRPTALTEQARRRVDDHPGYPVDSETPVAETFKRGESQVIDDVSTIDDGYDRGMARSAAYLPLGKYGVVTIAHDEPAVFDETDLDLASILVSNAKTALRRLESEQDLQRQNERLEAFVDVISHDIPNHLNVAETRLDLGRDGDTEHLDHVATAHDRIESLIADMRMLVDHGTQIEETTWNRLGDVARRCLAASLEDESVATLSVATEGYVSADESRLKQVFENLFWNAVEHSSTSPDSQAPEDAVEYGSTSPDSQARQDAVEHGDPHIRVGLLDDGFFVADDGPGIPSEDREQVLSPGFTTAEDGHSGFGLAIVREIARAHGWSVEITESDDGGARFEFTGATVRSE